MTIPIYQNVSTNSHSVQAPESRKNQRKNRHQDKPQQIKTKVVAYPAFEEFKKEEISNNLASLKVTCETPTKEKQEAPQVTVESPVAKEQDNVQPSIEQTTNLNFSPSDEELDLETFEQRQKKLEDTASFYKNIEDTIAKLGSFRAKLIAEVKTPEARVKHKDAYEEHIGKSNEAKDIIDKRKKDAEQSIQTSKLEKELLNLMTTGTGVWTTTERTFGIVLTHSDRFGITLRLKEISDLLANTAYKLTIKPDDQPSLNDTSLIDQLSLFSTSSTQQTEDFSIGKEIKNLLSDVRLLSEKVVQLKEELLVNNYCDTDLAQSLVVKSNYTSSQAKFKEVIEEFKALKNQKKIFTKDIDVMLEKIEKEELTIRLNRINHRINEIEALLKNKEVLTEQDSNAVLSQTYTNLKSFLDEIVNFKENLALEQEWQTKLDVSMQRAYYFINRKKLDELKNLKEKKVDGENSIYKNRLKNLENSIEEHQQDLRTMQTKLDCINEHDADIQKQFKKMKLESSGFFSRLLARS